MSTSNLPRLAPLCAMLVAILFGSATVSASESHEETVTKGRTLLEKARLDPNAKELDQARPLFASVAENSEAKAEVRAWAHYYVALTDYRSIPMAQKKGKEAATTHIDGAIGAVEKAIELSPKHAEAHALLSSLLGRKISLDPSQMMSLGMRSSQSLLTARQIAPKNPRVLLLDGISKLHTPEQWGGGAKSALAVLEKSVTEFEKKAKEKTDPKASPLEARWGEDEAYAWLGVTQLRLGKKEKARIAFERALEVNPKFDWVRKELLPQCEK